MRFCALVLVVTFVASTTATCSNFCIEGESRSTPFSTRVANAKDLVVVEVTSEPEPRPAIGHPGQFSYVYTATVRKVLKGCLAPGATLRIHQIRKSATIVAACPNPVLGHGAEISIWTGKPKKLQGLRSSPVPRLLTPNGGMFLISGCRVLKDPEVFFLNPCGIAEAVSADWELVAVAGNANVRSLLGPGTWSEVAVLNEKTATVQSIWTTAEQKRQAACANTAVWCGNTHKSNDVDIETFKAHRLALQTDGGKWVANEYKKSPDGDGCIMNLEFIPKDTVRGTKIALIQRNLKVEKGNNYDTLTRANILKWRQDQQLAPDLRDKTLTIQPVQRRKDARGDGVSHIDRAIAPNNPIYGAPDLRLGNPGDALDATPVGVWNPAQIDRSKDMCNYQLGGVAGTTVRAARLYDMPLCLGCVGELERSMKAKDNPLKVSSFTFETTAVVIEGPDTGKYLGSVQWGFEMSDSLCFENEDTETFQCHVALLPFTVVSRDKASDDMKRVIAAWNQGFYDYTDPTAPTLRNPQIPPVP